MKQVFFSLLLACCLSACGFHLRGSIALPQWLENIAIVSDSNDKELLSQLQSQLESYHVSVNPEPETAQYWLVIQDFFFQQKIVSIGASTNPRQYQLILTLHFLLQTRQGKMIKPQSAVTVSRQLTLNNDRILGSNSEEMTLINEMKRDAAIQILHRLAWPSP